MNQTQQRRLHWGVMGGAWINCLFIPGLKTANNAVLMAIASRNQAKAEAIAAKYDVPRTYGNYAALLTDPEIEAVYIPLPNTLHIEWAMRAIAAGKHVLVEKPLTLDPNAITQLEKMSKSAGVLAMEGFMYRFHPQHTHVKMLLASGTIGDLMAVRGTFAFPVSSQTYNIRLDKEMGGGATWDLGCYGVNVARWFFDDEPQAVYAEATSRPGYTVDTSVTAILDFGHGRRAILDHSLDYGPRSTYELLGTKGSIAIENLWQMPDKPAIIYLRSGEELHQELVSVGNHFQLQIEAFSQAIITNQPAPYSLADARANTLACIGILKSIAENRRVSLAEVISDFERRDTNVLSSQK